MELPNCKQSEEAPRRIMPTMLPAMPSSAGPVGPRRPLRNYHHQPTGVTNDTSQQAAGALVLSQDYSADSSPIGIHALGADAPFYSSTHYSGELLPCLETEPWEDIVHQIVWSAGRTFSELLPCVCVYDPIVNLSAHLASHPDECPHFCQVSRHST